MVGLPLCAVALYALVGTPGALAPQPATSTADSAAPPHGTDPAQVEAMVATLAARLKADPSNGDGWIMLGRSYSSLSRHAEASAAYKNAVAHSPPNAQLLADYADALAMAQGRQLFGEPEKLIVRALEIDGKNMKALALAGTVAFEKRDYNGAIALWSRMRALAPPDSEEARAIDSNIAEARSLGGEGGTVAVAPAPSVPAAQPSASAPIAQPTAPGTPPAIRPAASKSAAVSGVVKLAAELSGKVSPTDTVFIFARAASGPPMPLAVLRKQVRDLPVTFKLDDTMAMMPAMKLSDFPQVVLGARISKSANATPQPGDLQGITDVVRNDAHGLLVIISNEVR
jgi:cytochrome c-type biogenesis protein CcmH